MAKQVFIHIRLSRAYLALARLSCYYYSSNRNWRVRPCCIYLDLSKYGGFMSYDITLVLVSSKTMIIRWTSEILLRILWLASTEPYITYHTCRPIWRKFCPDASPRLHV